MLTRAPAADRFDFAPVAEPEFTTRTHGSQEPKSRPVQAAPPSVSIWTFYSFQNLCDQLASLTQAACDRLGAAVELPLNFSPHWGHPGFPRGRGGRLAIVRPRYSRRTLPDLSSPSNELQIAGWDDARSYGTMDQALESLLQGSPDIERCVVFHPEWHDPTPTYAAIGRHITAGR